MFSKFQLQNPIRPPFSPFDEIRILNIHLGAVRSQAQYERARHEAQTRQIQAELESVRREAASLREKLKVALQKNEEIKSSVKFLQTKQSFWDLSRSAKFTRKKMITEFLKKTMKKLPNEFKPVEVGFPPQFYEWKSSHYHFEDLNHAFFCCCCFLDQVSSK